MRKKILCVDIDNVIAQTDEVMRSVIKSYTKGRVDLRYADIIDYDYCNCEDLHNNQISKEEWHQIHRIFSSEENILRIQPFPRIQGVLSKLSSVFTLHIVTSRLSEARGPTLLWLKNHNFPDHHIHFVGHREKHNLFYQIDAVIEDDYEQALLFARDRNIPSYLIKHPWNTTGKPHKLITWIENWDLLYKSLIQ